MDKQDESGTLDQIKEIWEEWEDSRHQYRSSHAMVKINKIFKEGADR